MQLRSHNQATVGLKPLTYMDQRQAPVWPGLRIVLYAETYPNDG